MRFDDSLNILLLAIRITDALLHCQVNVGLCLECSNLNCTKQSIVGYALKKDLVHWGQLERASTAPDIRVPCSIVRYIPCATEYGIGGPAENSH